jgi:hypothetical protein
VLTATRLGGSTPQHIELMVKDENFGLQRCARPQQPGHGVPDQLEKRQTAVSSTPLQN